MNIENRRSFLRGLAATGCAMNVPVNAWGLTAVEHPLERPLRLVQQSLSRLDSVAGYECQFVKQEIVGERVVSQKLRMKLRHEPFSVYLYFEDYRPGREVIYVQGQNDNNLVIHEAGVLSLAGTLQRSPEHADVKAENRHPITELGLRKLAEALIRQWTMESRYSETDVKYFRDARLGSMTCNVIESSHPTPRRQFPFQKTRVWIDQKTNLVVRLQQYAFPADPDAPAALVEDYSYLAVRISNKLADIDFDVRNPAYSY